MLQVMQTNISIAGAIGRLTMRERSLLSGSLLH
jgi:hypothetical protein